MPIANFESLNESECENGVYNSNYLQKKIWMLAVLRYPNN